LTEETEITAVYTPEFDRGQIGKTLRGKKGCKPSSDRRVRLSERGSYASHLG